jgi:hypothetical protein
MEEYIDIRGNLQEEKIEGLIQAIRARFPHAVEVAREAWGEEVLAPAGLGAPEALHQALEALPGRIRDLFARVRLQVLQLEETIQRWTELGRGDRGALHAMDLKRKLLGIRGEGQSGREEADDRTSGHPMRRFAEFGILPGYEFPAEPATLRLWGDANEDDPISVERRFGIGQYQPDARVHARSHRWRVVGLDPASPWNPKAPEPGWIYVRCRSCGLRYAAQEHVRCARCGSEETAGRELPGHEFGGFLALRDDTPVLEEEDRFVLAALVRCYPQWSGTIAKRCRLATGWLAELRRGEEIRWLNEGRPPTGKDIKDGKPHLHEQGRGFYLCPSCGRSLTVPDDDASSGRGRRRARRGSDSDPFGHATGCPRRGDPPTPVAITAKSVATTLRIVVTLPKDMNEGDYARWGYSLGYALRTGMRHLYMLDGSEIEFELEPMWRVSDGQGARSVGALTFVDPTVGGSGFLDRAAEELHSVAARTIEHLDHAGCESACYRCLKSYQNQRDHQHLNWPQVMPDLEQLAQSAPVPVAADAAADDPRPWLEAYDAGVGSPLELKFLRLFDEHGLAVEKQVPSQSRRTRGNGLSAPPTS